MGGGGLVANKDGRIQTVWCREAKIYAAIRARLKTQLEMAEAVQWNSILRTFMSGPKTEK
jgi:hypothetical protein